MIPEEESTLAVEDGVGEVEEGVEEGIVLSIERLSQARDTMIRNREEREVEKRNRKL